MSTELVQQQQFVAVSAAELVPAQAQLIGWCRAKIVSLSHELAEQRQNHREAKAMLWRHHGWAKAITKTKNRMISYAKLKSAAQLGYLVVPNFDVDVVAVRVSRPPKLEMDRHQATADLLPRGVGRYVDDQLNGYDQKREWKDSDGKTRSCTDFHPTSYDNQIDFPVALVKPQILTATRRAMAHRLFDRIAVVRGRRRSDPLVVGQILDPSNSPWARRQNPKCISFFIAWWLDTKDL